MEQQLVVLEILQQQLHHKDMQVVVHKALQVLRQVVVVVVLAVLVVLVFQTQE
jgi:hypothetical protein